MSEKKQMLKKIDDRIISASNRFLGNERVHSIDYLTKFLNKYRDEKVAKVLHLARVLFAQYEVEKLFEENKVENNKVVKLKN